jgi:hypothetical protein
MASFFGSKILRTMATDEIAPSRFLMMDDAMLNLDRFAQEETKSNKPISLLDVSDVIDSVLQTKNIKIATESKDTNNIDYEISVKGNRKLNLLVNIQDDSLRLKLSSTKENFDKEMQISTDSEDTKKGIQSFLDGSFNEFKSQTEGRLLVQRTISDNNSLMSYLKQSEQLSRKFEFLMDSGDSRNSRIQIQSKSSGGSNEVAEVAIVDQVTGERESSKSGEPASQNYVKIWFNLKEQEKIQDHHRHALFVRSINLTDDDSAVELFIAEKLNEIMEMKAEKSVKNPFVSFEAAVQKFVSWIKSFTNPQTNSQAFSVIDDHIKDISGNPQIKSNSHIIYGNFQGSPNYDIQVVLFKMNEKDEIGIHIGALDREYEAKIPLFEFDSRFDTIKPVIAQILLPDPSSTPFNSLKSAADKINTTIKTICDGKHFYPVQLANSNAVLALQVYANPKGDADVASYKDSYKHRCPFNFAQIRIMQYSFGYFHFIHLSIDYEYLHSEYMLSPHSASFNDNVDEIFRELYSELVQLREDHNNNLVGQQLTLSRITHIFEKIMKQEKSDSSADFVRFFTEDKTMKVDIKKLATGMIRISFVQNPWGKISDKTEKINVVKEIYIPENNGLNQLERMRSQILKILHHDIRGHIDNNEPSHQNEINSVKQNIKTNESSAEIRQKEAEKKLNNVFSAEKVTEPTTKDEIEQTNNQPDANEPTKENKEAQDQKLNKSKSSLANENVSEIKKTNSLQRVESPEDTNGEIVDDQTENSSTAKELAESHVDNSQSENKAGNSSDGTNNKTLPAQENSSTVQKKTRLLVLKKTKIV